MNWPSPPAGTYSLSAVSTDDLGAESSSPAVVITVQPPGGGGCLNPAWDPATSYSKGDSVSHQGNEWRAKRDNQNVEPGTSRSMWSNLGPCGS